MNVDEVADRLAVDGIKPVMSRWLAWQRYAEARSRFDQLLESALLALAIHNELEVVSIHRRANEVQAEMIAAWHAADGFDDCGRDVLFGWAKRWADRACSRFSGSLVADAGGHAASSVARALGAELFDAVLLLEAAGWNRPERDQVATGL